MLLCELTAPVAVGIPQGQDMAIFILAWHDTPHGLLNGLGPSLPLRLLGSAPRLLFPLIRNIRLIHVENDALQRETAYRGCGHVERCG